MTKKDVVCLSLISAFFGALLCLVIIGIVQSYTYSKACEAKNGIWMMEAKGIPHERCVAKNSFISLERINF